MLVAFSTQGQSQAFRSSPASMRDAFGRGAKSAQNGIVEIDGINPPSPYM